MYDYQMEYSQWENSSPKINPMPKEPESYKFEIDLNKVSVKWPENLSNTIKIPDNNITVKMRYPDASLYTNKQFLAASGEKLIDYLIQNSIASIDSSLGQTKPKDIPLNELIEFLDGLPIMVYDQIRAYLSNLPHVYYELNYKNKKGHERKIVLDKLSDFFTF